MPTAIKTNKLNYILNHKKIDEQYDIFIVQTSMKYFKSEHILLMHRCWNKTYVLSVS